MAFVVRKSNTHNFRLVEETWSPERKEKVVPRESYPALGFRYDMTVEEARLRAKQINKQNQIESSKIVKAVKRIKDAEETESAYLPNHLVNGFENELRDNYLDNPDRLNNLLKQWSIVKKTIAILALDPKDFYAERQKFFNYYRDKAWAPDYIKKLTRLINLWGLFVSRKTNSFFQPLPKLSNIQIEKVHENREGKSNIKTVADPLFWDDLRNLKTRFENDNLLKQWNWMLIGLWFGLRPKEIDSLTNTKNWRLEKDPRNNVTVLMVYQSKLTSVSKDKRWKPIPIYFDEQKEALQYITTGDFKRPLNKTLKRFFDSKIETYSPRKGFTDLMLERGFSLEDISVFLGHADISMTWKHYKNKMTFKLPNKPA